MGGKKSWQLTWQMVAKTNKQNSLKDHCCNHQLFSRVVLPGRLTVCSSKIYKVLLSAMLSHLPYHNEHMSESSRLLFDTFFIKEEYSTYDT